jgi:anti-sigma regulatory factor (Ser/Thr protein kinase)
MQASALLAADPVSAAAARALVETTLPMWGCDELVDDVRLVITELVSNGVLHARTPLEVCIEIRDDALRVAVHDSAAGTVAVRDDADPTRIETGRGLKLVETLSDAWGVDPSDEAKVVWAEWRLPR